MVVDQQPQAIPPPNVGISRGVALGLWYLLRLYFFATDQVAWSVLFNWAGQLGQSGQKLRSTALHYSVCRTYILLTPVNTKAINTCRDTCGAMLSQLWLYFFIAAQLVQVAQLIWICWTTWTVWAPIKNTALVKKIPCFWWEFLPYLGGEQDWKEWTPQPIATNAASNKRKLNPFRNNLILFHSNCQTWNTSDTKFMAAFSLRFFVTDYLGYSIPVSLKLCHNSLVFNIWFKLVGTILFTLKVLNFWKFI